MEIRFFIGLVNQLISTLREEKVKSNKIILNDLLLFVSFTIILFKNHFKLKSVLFQIPSKLILIFSSDGDVDDMMHTQGGEC